VGELKAASDVKSVTWEAKVIRRDGTVEDLGVISEWHRNPIKRLMRSMKRGKR
jgi:hypothetical protein